MSKRIDVVRLEKSDQGALGVLLIDGVMQCWTLQPDPTDQHFYIPPGSYVYRRFHGQLHRDTFEVVVAGHTALLFHAGNTEEHTEGCILLGASLGYIESRRAVFQSKFAFNSFMTLMANEDTGTVFFWDLFPLEEG